MEKNPTIFKAGRVDGGFHLNGTQYIGEAYEEMADHAAAVAVDLGMPYPQALLEEAMAQGVFQIEGDDQ